MKKSITTVMIICILSVQCFAVKLPNGKPVSVRLTTEVHSNTKNKQDIFAIVDKDVTDTNTGAVLIKRGSPVTVSADITKARGVGKRGEVRLTCVATTSVDGQEISLQGSYIAVGESKQGLALGLGIGLGIFAWPALFCLCIKGEKIELPANMLIHNVVVNDDYIINTANN